MKISIFLVVSLAVNIISASYSPPCNAVDTSCLSYAGNLCCNSTVGEKCFQGYHSGVCCGPTETGCCGKDGQALGGCKCISASEEQCCGTTDNAVCKSDETCCANESGATICCSSNEECQSGKCVTVTATSSTVLPSSTATGDDACSAPGDKLCSSYSGSECCKASQNQTCYQGYHSGVCCTAPQTGCCGKDGQALGGCKCIDADQQCCGTIDNAVCEAGQTCCPSANGDNTTCCNANEQCSDGKCVTVTDTSSNPTTTPPSATGDDTCSAPGDELCSSYSGSECCKASQNQTCYQGYHSGVCCTAPQTGCCGKNGQALGGCKCIDADQQCCGSVDNTVCTSSQTCCFNGDNAVCCNSGEQCSNGACVASTNEPDNVDAETSSGSSTFLSIVLVHAGVFFGFRF